VLFLGRDTPVGFRFSASVDAIRAKAEVLRLSTLNLPFLNPWMARIQLGEIHCKGDVLDLSASNAAEVAVLFRNGIEALLPAVRMESMNHSLGCHEFQVAIHGSEADVRKPFLYPQVYLVGTGMIPAEAEFLENHGPLFCFSQRNCLL
jgi:hypothetical protein